MKSYLSLAISKLCPSAQFSFDDDDYATIVWNKLDQKAPTNTEIDAAIKEIKAEEIKAEADKAAAKEAAQAKLSALGLTSEDLKALGL